MLKIYHTHYALGLFELEEKLTALTEALLSNTPDAEINESEEFPESEGW